MRQYLGKCISDAASVRAEILQYDISTSAIGLGK